MTEDSHRITPGLGRTYAPRGGVGVVRFEVDHCALSRRVDGPKHSWRFDGDDPRIVCVYCDEVRDAISGLVIRNGRRA